MKNRIIKVGTKSKNSLHSDNMNTEAMMVKLRNFTGLLTVKPVENGAGNNWKVIIVGIFFRNGKIDNED